MEGSCFGKSWSGVGRGYNSLGTDAWGQCGTLDRCGRIGGYEVVRAGFEGVCCGVSAGGRRADRALVSGAGARGVLADRTSGRGGVTGGGLLNRSVGRCG